MATAPEPRAAERGTMIDVRWRHPLDHRGREMRSLFLVACLTVGTDMGNGKMSTSLGAKLGGGARLAFQVLATGCGGSDVLAGRWSTTGCRW